MIRKQQIQTVRIQEFKTMINKRSYLNHVQLIDSQCDTMRNQMPSNQPSFSNNPPMLSINNNYHRSPLRDRQSKLNLSNTPLRSGKSSLSPLRMRKGEASNNSFVGNSSIRMTRRKQQRVQQQRFCFNHSQKGAKFYVQAPDEVMHCCQKCAILLASQGFTVCKLQPSQLIEQSSRKQSNPRKTQIQGFMGDLQSLQRQLKSIQCNFQQKFTSSQSQLQQQLSNIEQYYQQFYQILNEHKKRVIFQMKEEYAKNNSQSIKTKKELHQAIEETDSMKKDILQSWNDIIFVAKEHQYRPVIRAYHEKFQSFQQLIMRDRDLPEFIVRKLNFINTESACEALEKALQVEWDDQEKQEQEEQNEHDEPHAHQQNDQMGKYSKQSDLPENPVECVEKDEKFIKSSLKDLVGLFSSFDQ